MKINKGLTVANNGDELKKIPFVYRDSSQAGKEVKSNVFQFYSNVLAFSNSMRDTETAIKAEVTSLSDQMLGIRAGCSDSEAFKDFCGNIRDAMKWGQGDGKIAQPNWFRDYVKHITAADKFGIVPFEETEITGTVTNDITGESDKVTAKVTPVNLNQMIKFTKAAKKGADTVKKLQFTGFDKGLKMDKVEDAEYIGLLRDLSGSYVSGGTKVHATVLEALTGLLKSLEVVKVEDEKEAPAKAA